MKDRVKLLIFRANGKAFSAGVEVAEHMGGQAEKMIEVFHGMFRLMDKLNVPSIAVIAEAAAFIKKFSKNSSIVLKLTRSSLLEGTLEAQEKDLTSIENIYFNRLMKTHDAQEGLQSFIDKRKPNWQDR